MTWKIQSSDWSGINRNVRIISKSQTQSWGSFPAHWLGSKFEPLLVICQIGVNHSQAISEDN